MQPLEQATFGDYVLQDRIGAGGMAEIFLALRRDGSAPRRCVVIKRILPHLSEDAQFVRMFIEEAKLCMALRHPNIVEVYELGDVDGQYFISMEYVDGRDLLKTLGACGRRKIGFPTDLALYAVMHVLRGLAHAHERRRADGTPLGIIHRDVSPSNVLLSHGGEVKIGDFGIAKAATREKTATGVLKGKFGYMAPEQVVGAKIDHRADIFATGILLYELLTGHRLFAGKNDLAVLERVRTAVIDPLPRFYRPDLEPDLEGIVLRALERNVAERFQSAAELHDALSDYVRRSGVVVGPAQLARFMQALFLTEPDEIARRKQMGLPSAESFAKRRPANGSGTLGRGANVASSGALDRDESRTERAGSHVAPRPAARPSVSVPVETRPLASIGIARADEAHEVRFASEVGSFLDHIAKNGLPRLRSYAEDVAIEEPDVRTVLMEEAPFRDDAAPAAPLPASKPSLHADGPSGRERSLRGRRRPGSPSHDDRSGPDTEPRESSPTPPHLLLEMRATRPLSSEPSEPFGEASRSRARRQRGTTLEPSRDLAETKRPPDSAEVTLSAEVLRDLDESIDGTIDGESPVLDTPLEPMLPIAVDALDGEGARDDTRETSHDTSKFAEDLERAFSTSSRTPAVPERRASPAAREDSLSDESGPLPETNAEHSILADTSDGPSRSLAESSPIGTASASSILRASSSTGAPRITSAGRLADEGASELFGVLDALGNETGDFTGSSADEISLETDARVRAPVSAPLVPITTRAAPIAPSITRERISRQQHASDAGSRSNDGRDATRLGPLLSRVDRLGSSEPASASDDIERVDVSATPRETYDSQIETGKEAMVSPRNVSLRDSSSGFSVALLPARRSDVSRSAGSESTAGVDPPLPAAANGEVARDTNERTELTQEERGAIPDHVVAREALGAPVGGLEIGDVPDAPSVQLVSDRFDLTAPPEKIREVPLWQEPPPPIAVAPMAEAPAMVSHGTLARVEGRIENARMASLSRDVAVPARASVVSPAREASLAGDDTRGLGGREALPNVVFPSRAPAIGPTRPMEAMGTRRRAERWVMPILFVAVAIAVAGSLAAVFWRDQRQAASSEPVLAPSRQPSRATGIVPPLEPRTSPTGVVATSSAAHASTTTSSRAVSASGREDRRPAPPPRLAAPSPSTPNRMQEPEKQKRPAAPKRSSEAKKTPAPTPSRSKVGREPVRKRDESALATTVAPAAGELATIRIDCRDAVDVRIKGLQAWKAVKQMSTKVKPGVYEIVLSRGASVSVSVRVAPGGTAKLPCPPGP